MFGRAKPRRFSTLRRCSARHLSVPFCAGVIVTLLSVTSCGADNAPTDGARATGGPKAATTAREPSVSRRDPAAIIITIDDLPSSWREAPEPEDEGGGSGSCLDSVTDSVFRLPPTGDAAVAAFTQSDLGPLLLAMVATPVDDVETSFDALVDRMAACDGTTDDAGYTSVAEPSKLPTIGDETLAIQATASHANGSKVSYLLAVARANDTIVLAAHILSLGEIDVALVEDAVRTMVGSLMFRPRAPLGGAGGTPCRSGFTATIRRGGCLAAGGQTGARRTSSTWRLPRGEKCSDVMKVDFSTRRAAEARTVHRGRPRWRAPRLRPARRTWTSG